MKYILLIITPIFHFTSKAQVFFTGIADVSDNHEFAYYDSKNYSLDLKHKVYSFGINSSSNKSYFFCLKELCIVSDSAISNEESQLIRCDSCYKVNFNTIKSNCFEVPRDSFKYIKFLGQIVFQPAEFIKTIDFVKTKQFNNIQIDSIGSHFDLVNEIALINEVKYRIVEYCFIRVINRDDNQQFYASFLLEQSEEVSVILNIILSESGELLFYSGL